jgi:hypothetical protein
VNLSIPKARSEAIKFSQDEVNEVLTRSDIHAFTDRYEALMTRKFQEFLDKAGGRDVVLYTKIPPSVESKFATFNIIGYGLREITKAVGVRKGVRTQVLGYRAFEPYDLADGMWNLSLAAYVQAGGRPWKIKEIPRASIFMGIAYGIKKDEKGQTIVTGLAKIFNTYGEYVDIAALDFESKDFIIDPKLIAFT